MLLQSQFNSSRMNKACNSEITVIAIKLLKSRHIDLKRKKKCACKECIFLDATTI